MSTTVAADSVADSVAGGSPFGRAHPLVLSVEGQLIVSTRQQFKQRIIDAIGAGNRDIVLDFASCGYVDASGCGVLVSISKLVREAGGTLVLCHLNEDLVTLFEITQLTTLFTIRPTQASALALFTELHR